MDEYVDRERPRRDRKEPVGRLEIPPAAMRRGSRRQPGCRRRGGYRRYGPVHEMLLSGDGGACFRASVVGLARFTPFQGWWPFSSFEAKRSGRCPFL